jgi:Co/Zn/Cd efflux system component
MKYLSLIVFLIALQWTWSFSHRPSNISESAHVGIQVDLKKIISDYITENLPTSRNLRFEKFWSEQLKKNVVKASFVYSFDDEDQESGNARVVIEGYAILNRDSKLDETFDYWNLDELYILNNKIDFKDPMLIDLQKDGTKK